MKDQPVQYGPPFQRVRSRKSKSNHLRKRARQNKGLERSTRDALGRLAWYLIRVPSQKEFVVERVLDDAGMVVFVPIERRFRKANGYRKKRQELRFPLIPGYALVALDPAAPRWGELFAYRMVLAVVGRHGVPSRVSFREVERLLIHHAPPESLAADGRRWARRGLELAAGDQVELLDGPFVGHVAEIAEIQGGVAKMLMRIFGGEQKVEMPVSALGRVA